MKKLIEEVSGEGLEKLLGETVTLFCLNYFYNGKLVGVNSEDVLLENPKLIYETGEWSAKEWKDAQSMGMDELYVRIDKIESYGKTK